MRWDVVLRAVQVVDMREERHPRATPRAARRLRIAAPLRVRMLRRVRGGAAAGTRRRGRARREPPPRHRLSLASPHRPRCPHDSHPAAAHAAVSFSFSPMFLLRRHARGLGVRVLSGNTTRHTH